MKLLTVECISPYGTTIEAHLSAKKSGIAPRKVQLEYVVEGKKRKIEVEKTLDPTTTLPAPDSVIRRMSRSTLMTLSTLEEAKKRCSYDWANFKMGLLVGTTNGPAQTNMDYIKRLLKYDYKGASPNLFAQSVHNNIASSIALTYGWKGPNLTLVQEENLWTALMNTAELWLKEQNVDLLWLIVGNETSLHLPYIKLFEETQKNSSLESYAPNADDISSESFSCFLLCRDDFTQKDSYFDLERTRSVAATWSRPEKLGLGVAEHFYQKYFL